MSSPAKSFIYSEILGPKERFCLFDQNIFHYIRTKSRTSYRSPALNFGDIPKRWNYGDLRKRIEGMARNLVSSGARPSARVLSFSPSCCESYFLQLACNVVGCIYVPVPPKSYTPENLRCFLNQFQPQILHVSEEYSSLKDGKNHKRSFYETLYSVIPELALSYPGQRVQHHLSEEFPYLKKCFISGRGSGSASSNIRGFQCPSYSLHEDPLRRFHLLLHRDEPIIALHNPQPAIEDKVFTCYSHAHCMNAGKVLSSILSLGNGSRIASLAEDAYSPVGAIIAPYAALGCDGEYLSLQSVLSDASEQETNDSNMEKIDCILLSKTEAVSLVAKPTCKALHSARLYAIFEESSTSDTSMELMKEVKQKAQADDVYIFKGPMESCFMITCKSLRHGNIGVLPYTGLKVVGDRGTYDAKILAAGMRGNLKLRGPHVTPYFYNNAGLMTEFQDEFGWVSTSRDAILHDEENWTSLGAQEY